MYVGWGERAADLNPIQPCSFFPLPECCLGVSRILWPLCINQCKVCMCALCVCYAPKLAQGNAYSSWQYTTAVKAVSIRDVQFALESSDFVFENNINNEKAFNNICSFGWSVTECVKYFIVLTVRDLTVGLCQEF